MDSGAQEAVYFVSSYHRVAEVARRREGHSLKSLNWDENLYPNIRYFCRDIKVCRKLRTFTSKKTFKTIQTDHFMSRNETRRAGLSKLTSGQGLEWMTTKPPFSFSSHQLFERLCKFGIMRKDDTFVAKTAKQEKNMAILRSPKVCQLLSYHDIWGNIICISLFQARALSKAGL